MPLRRKIYSHSLVINGSFNPKIFQPLWFSSEGLAGKTEATNANIQIIHDDITDFEIRGISIRVTRGQFLASTFQDGFFEILKDLVIGTFSILSHTPVTALGINQSMHIELSQTSSWNGYASKVVNTDYWQETLGDAVMEDITYRKPRSNSIYPGYQRIKLQPSIQVKNGLFFEFNNHYDLPEDQEGSIRNAMSVVEMIESDWQESIATGQMLIEKLLEDNAS